MDEGLRDIIEKLAKIEVKIDDIGKMKDTIENQGKDIVSIKSTQTNQQKIIDEMKADSLWLKRAVIGAIITAVVGILVVIFKIGLGL